MRLWLVGAIIALVLLAILAGRIGSERGWGRYFSLMRDGISSTGIITGADGQEVCRVDYSYQVAGATYSGSAPVCGYRVGQQVPVTYLAHDPSLSCLGSPGDRLAEEAVSSLLGRLAFPEM